MVGAAQQQIQQGTAPAGAAATASQGSSGGAGASSAAHDGAASAGSIFCMTAAGRPVGQPAAAGANYMVVDAGGSQSLAAAGLYAAAGGAGVDEDGVGGDENGDQMQCSTSHDLDVMLRQRELERLVDDQQMVGVRAVSGVVSGGDKGGRRWCLGFTASGWGAGFKQHSFLQ